MRRFKPRGKLAKLAFLLEVDLEYRTFENSSPVFAVRPTGSESWTFRLSKTGVALAALVMKYGILEPRPITVDDIKDLLTWDNFTIGE